jgi:lipopolysaccharide transport system ATP-binding protein
MPEASDVVTPMVSCRNLTIRFPVYGVDSRSLKKHLAGLTIGGRLKNKTGGMIVTALADVNLELRAGDRLGLIGHNGSGKTTLLRALAGAYEPDEGQVEVRGRTSALLDIGLGLDPTATGYENIRLRARISGLPTSVVNGMIDEIGDFTGLGSFLAMPVKTYSQGMMARLAFAAATAAEADVLLMDEWVAVGDTEFKALAQKRLERLADRAGILMLASHDPATLTRYCNKVVRFHHGAASEVTDIAHLDALMAA